jgi:hypothetical protein
MAWVRDRIVTHPATPSEESGELAPLALSDTSLGRVAARAPSVVPEPAAVKVSFRSQEGHRWRVFDL